MEVRMKISFEIPMTKKEIGKYSFNKLYATMHWTKRKAAADYFHSLTQCALYSQKIPKKLFEAPVKITMYFNSNLDISNHSWIAKMIEDGMKDYLIQDDNKKFVHELDQKFYEGEGILVQVEEKFF